MAKIYYWRDMLGDLEPFSEYHQEINALLDGDYRSLHLEKLRGQKKYPIYCIRVNRERGTRLLFTVFEGKICLLEVVENHNYQKSLFLSRGGLPKTATACDAVEEDTFDKVGKIDEIIAAPESATEHVPLEFHQQQLISFNTDQTKAISASLPAILYGPAGSGKTCVAISMLSNYVRKHRGDPDAFPVVYITQSPHLVDKMRRSWQASLFGDETPQDAVIFTTYIDLVHAELPPGEQICTDEATIFSDWHKEKVSKKGAAKSSIDLSAKAVWEEFRIRSGYNAIDYMALGARQTTAKQEDRAILSSWHDDYIGYLQSRKMVSPALHSLEGRIRYALVVADEAQDFSLCQLRGLKKIAHNDSVAFFLGDHQILFDGKSRFSYLKSLLSSFGAGSPISEIQLPGTYRCSRPVIELANRLIALKYSVTGGTADKVETPEISVANEAMPSVGECTFVQLDHHVELAALREAAKRPNLVVVTFPEYLSEARHALDTRLIFTPEQVKGLEYDTVVIWRPLDCPDGYEACEKLGDTTKSASTHRAKKGQGNDALLPYFNRLITAVTRAQRNVFLVQDSIHKIERMYNALNPKVSQLKPVALAPKSVPRIDPVLLKREWETEVKRLLSHGNELNAREIFIDKLGHSPQDYEALKKSLQVPMSVGANARMPLPKDALKAIAPICDADVKRMGAKKRSESPTPHPVKKIPVKVADGVIQKHVTTLVSNFSKMRLQTLLAVYGAEAILLCPIASGTQQPLLRYIFSTIENTKTFISCLLNNHQIRHELLVSPVWKHILRQAKDQSPDIKIALDTLISIATDKYINETSVLIPESELIHLLETRDYVDMITLLLHAYELDPNKKIKGSLETPACLAAQFGHATFITALHECGADLNAKNAQGWTPAHFAAAKGHGEIITILHQCRADLNAPNVEGWTPAHFAASWGYTEVLTALHQGGVDLSTQYLDRWTVAHLAAKNGHTKNIIALHLCGVDLSVKDNQGATPAHIAAENGHTEVILALHQCGAALSAQYTGGRTLGHFAAENGYTAMITALHQHGVDLSVKCNEGATLAHLAAENGYTEVITALHQCRVDLNTQCPYGWTPAHIAAENGHAEIITVLHQCGTNLNAKCHEGWTPTHIAAEKGYTEVIIALHQCGADLGAKTFKGFTPAHIAIDWGRTKVITTLHQCGLNLGSQNMGDWTLAHVTANLGYTKFILELHQCGVDLNNQDIRGNTPAHLAAAKGHAETISVLYECGADFNAKNHRDLTPADIAMQFGKKKIVSAILDKRLMHSKVHPIRLAGHFFSMVQPPEEARTTMMTGPTWN